VDKYSGRSCVGTKGEDIMKKFLKFVLLGILATVLTAQAVQPFVVPGITVTGAVAGGSIKNTSYGITNIFVFTTAPVIASGFGTTPAIVTNGTKTIRLTIGTGGVATTGTLTMPAATVGWNVTGIRVFAPTATNLLQTTAVTASNTTSITLTNYTTSTGAVVAWPASTILMIETSAY
jgi:hypothetical protein